MNPYDPYSGGPPQGGFGPPPGYAGPDVQAGGQAQANLVQRLEKEGLTWIIVAAAGFVLGAVFITGPLAWWQGARLRAEYRAAGMAPTGNATVAWVLGMVSTALAVVIFMGVCVAVAAGLWLAARAQAPH